MTPASIQSQMERCRALLAPERAKVTLTEVGPERAPASLGAVGAVGFEAKDPDVAASVYFFESVDRHGDAIAQLTRDMSPQAGVYILYGANGTMLFFGHTRTDGPLGEEAEDRLGNIAAAFSGDE